MEISIDKINSRSDPYQLFLDSIRSPETLRRYKTHLHSFLKLIPNQIYVDSLDKTPDDREAPTLAKFFVELARKDMDLASDVIAAIIIIIGSILGVAGYSFYVDVDVTNTIITTQDSIDNSIDDSTIDNSIDQSIGKMVISNSTVTIVNPSSDDFAEIHEDKQRDDVSTKIIVEKMENFLLRVNQIQNTSSFSQIEIDILKYSHNTLKQNITNYGLSLNAEQIAEIDVIMGRLSMFDVLFDDTSIYNHFKDKEKTDNQLQPMRDFVEKYKADD